MSADNDSAGTSGTIGHYRLVERVGGGGMGTVYRAVDIRTGAAVALKVMHPHLEADKTYLERFRREAHVASLLRSPYTVQLQEFGQDGARHFLVSEFVEGRSLGDALKDGPVEPLAAIAIAVQVALALDEAESRGIVHRDIKPENILLTNDASVKVTDFGIARMTFSSGVTMPGMFVGTLAYSAPEQHNGQTDARSDIYSLGVVLFEMLAGQCPFNAPTPTGLIRLHEEAPPPLEKLAGVPQELIAVVAKCLEKDPAARYQHASELITALEAARPRLGRPTGEAWMSEATGWLAETRTGSPPGAAGIVAGAMSTGGVPAASAETLVGGGHPASDETRVSGGYPASVETRISGGHAASGETRVSGGYAAAGETRVSGGYAASGETGTSPPAISAGMVAGAMGAAAPLRVAAGSGWFERIPRPLLIVGSMAVAALLATGIALAVTRSGDSTNPASNDGKSAAGGGSPEAGRSPSASPSADRPSTPSPAASSLATTSGVSPTAASAATAPPATAPPVAVPPTAVPPTAIPPTPVPPTPTPSEPVYPAKSIASGDWDNIFTVVRNTCSDSPAVNDQVPYTFTLEEPGATKGYVLNGENVGFYDEQGEFLGVATLYWPSLTLTYDSENGGKATLTMTFSSASYGSADLSIYYPDYGCEVRYIDRS